MNAYSCSKNLEAAKSTAFTGFDYGVMFEAGACCLEVPGP